METQKDTFTAIRYINPLPDPQFPEIFVYSGFLKTCHPLSFRILPFFRFAQYGISQLSTSKYRAVVQQSKSYKHPFQRQITWFSHSL